MNTGQTMITIGAMLLLAAMVMRVNTLFNSTSEALTDSKLRVLAVSEAISIFEEASGKAFDNVSDTTAVYDPSIFTPVNKLGLDSGENASNPKTFNDFDDYLCYKDNPRIDSVQILTSHAKLPFKVFIDVCYVDPSNPNVPSPIPTFHKKMTIKVTGPALGTDTIKMSTVNSYWFFR